MQVKTPAFFIYKKYTNFGKFRVDIMILVLYSIIKKSVFKRTKKF